MTDSIRLGFALCGSFCTFEKAIACMEDLAKKGYDLTPIMSSTAYETDTRFGRALDIVARVEDICKKKVIYTITAAEPIGPQKLLDAIAVAPCTGNTLAKLAGGITDSAVTMACKAHLRNSRPVVLALSTNDALGASAVNIGSLLSRKNIYFVPFSQDDPEKKPFSMTADLSLLEDSVKAALDRIQLQPIVF